MIRRFKDASRAVDSHLDIPVPPGLSLFPYQKAGVVYALEHESTLLSDEMGLGKSPMSVCVSNCLPEIKKVLIISPASLKINWQREWKRFDTKNLSTGIAGKIFPDTDVCIINYDVLKKYRGELRQQEFDLMIVDEVHYLKSGKADRTKEVFGGIKRGPDKKIIERIPPILAKRRLFLSGTPILNKPKDIWNLVRELDPAGLGSDWFSFAKRYCQLFEIKRYNPQTHKEERVGWKWDGADNLEELQERMRTSFMIRRLKKDVLKELPPKRRSVIVLETKKSLTKLLKRETMAYDDYVKKHGEDKFESPIFGEVSKVRKEVALAKVPFVIEYLEEILNETQKVVVWVHHHEVADALSQVFRSTCVILDGRSDVKSRQKAIDDFQTKENCRLFIGGIQAAGVGITLTAASLCIFAELDWTPANISQAEDRLHRIGQKDSVQIQHLVLQGSLDERMAQVIIEKQEIADKALDKEKI